MRRAPTKRDIASVNAFYSTKRVVAGEEKSLYEIWEEGGSLNDSVTPSTYSREYQSHIVLKLLFLTRPEAVVFSIGCGNGVIEARLASLDRVVRGIDCNPEAVALSVEKGVDATQTDFFDLESGALADVDLVYGDGVIGHLFDADRGLDDFFAQIREAGLADGARLVLSNDAPRLAGVDVAPHDRVRDFWFLSIEYLSHQLERFGLRVVERYYFPYVRPESGLRPRSICVAEA
jgi:2-polyprenyl-3-methyl-5-hydroxy-6-metoxy-1,4-benzoquinol methylase